MTKQQRLEQLAVVTDIIERNLPWEYQRSSGEWDAPDASLFTVLAWENPIRIKPTPTLFPLEPSDIPPGSVISVNPSLTWFSILWLGSTALEFVSAGRQIHSLHFETLLKDNWLINRSLPLFGKWDPTAWEPCSKLPTPVGKP